MQNNASLGNNWFVGYRVGATYCLSPSSSLQAVVELPTNLVQLPGTKAWVMGVAKLGKELTPYINLPHFLNLPNLATHSQNKKQAPVLILREVPEVGSIALMVDEIVKFVATSDISDVEDPEFSVPLGFGSCLCGTVRALDRVWALIDLYTLTNDQNLHKIDLT